MVKTYAKGKYFLHTMKTSTERVAIAHLTQIIPLFVYFMNGNDCGADSLASASVADE
jgi:hypothetical protein